MGRVAIFGDIGGHRDELARQLVALGADPDTLRLPGDLTVVQVGDLVHRGPDSPGVVALVDRMVTTQPDQWVQLSGNHEGQYVHPPRFSWPEVLDDTTVLTMRRWWADGLMRVAAAVTTEDGEQLLVTHAGLTDVTWKHAGGDPDADKVAGQVNEWIPNHPRLTRAGSMLYGDRAPHAGPWWAEAGLEVYSSWAMRTLLEDEMMPFSQVHGHSSAYWFDSARWVNFPQVLHDRVTVDERARHVTLHLPGGRLVGVDPGHAKTAASTWAPLVVNGAVTAR